MRNGIVPKLRRFKMAKTQDYTKVLQDMMSALPFDTTSAQGAFKTSAALGEKMAKVALEAAEKSNPSPRWARSPR
jgi:hypothetical protein